MPFRIAVLQVPSPTEQAWRLAMAQAMASHDGIFAKSVKDFASADPDRNALVVISELADLIGLDVTDWVILSTDLASAAQAAGQKTPGYPRKTYKLLAQRLAPVGTLKNRGAIVLDAAAKSIDFPHLGTLTRSEVDPLPHVDIDLIPMGLYQQNPPAIGAKASWPLEVFRFKTLERSPLVPPKIDLTGRGRVVVFGPRHDMPTGHYRVTARFSVETEGSDIYLKFEWGVDHDLATLDLMLQKSGEYEIVMDHAWAEAGAMELRVWAANAHFVGLMQFHGADVERLPDVVVTPSVLDQA